MATNDGPKGEQDIEEGSIVKIFEDPTESDIVYNSSGVKNGQPPG